MTERKEKGRKASRWRGGRIKRPRFRAFSLPRTTRKRFMEVKQARIISNAVEVMAVRRAFATGYHFAHNQTGSKDKERPLRAKGDATIVHDMKAAAAARQQQQQQQLQFRVQNTNSIGSNRGPSPERLKKFERKASQSPCPDGGGRTPLPLQTPSR